MTSWDFRLSSPVLHTDLQPKPSLLHCYPLPRSYHQLYVQLALLIAMLAQANGGPIFLDGADCLAPFLLSCQATQTKSIYFVADAEISSVARLIVLLEACSRLSPDKPWSRAEAQTFVYLWFSRRLRNQDAVFLKEVLQHLRDSFTQFAKRPWLGQPFDEALAGPVQALWNDWIGALTNTVDVNGTTGTIVASAINKSLTCPKPPPLRLRFSARLHPQTERQKKYIVKKP